MVRALQMLASQSLPCAAAFPNLEGPKLANDVVNGASSGHVGVLGGLAHVVGLEGGHAADATVQEVLHDGVLHVPVHVAHPDHGRARVFFLHLLEFRVERLQLALVKGVATALAVAEVDASGDELLTGCLVLQHSPICRAVATPGGTSSRLNPALEGLPFVAVVEDVRAIALPTIATWLRLEPLANRRREGSCHFTHGRGQFAQTDDVRFLFLGDGFGDGSRVLVLVIHIPLQDVCLYLSSRNSHGSLRKGRPR
mmetsp:Transcript_16167/g.44707  ORF Transcript_16167/g.44707 Transcript_16167/m.44707 type:complete len:254 (+) Transcript_16167:481-1242(+)